MSDQGFGGNRCQSYGKMFNFLDELDTRTRKEHSTTTILLFVFDVKFLSIVLKPVYLINM
jgi:hypothetical protein